ncbi:MAG: hypothetical protein H6R45_1189, partial [Proteobacteria bacterium]|nr:hypothetical protein [Pseudomonadota bacterium]
KISSLPPVEAERLAARGLLVREEHWGGNDMKPAWRVRHAITREQVFPAGATVHVSHRYTPMIGGSVGGRLDHYGEADYAEDSAWYRQKYCTDAAFIAGFRKRQRGADAKARAGGYIGYGETWIGYVLSTGANWKGPIGTFRLTVDKGKAENLVSFCMDGVKKVSPTRFEVRKANYEPDRDLNILIVQWYSSEGE